jgi:exonuclease I
MRLLIIISLVLTACGAEPKQQEPQRFAEYRTEQDLPACSTGNENEVVYVQQSDAYLVCFQNGQWR